MVHTEPRDATVFVEDEREESGGHSAVISGPGEYEIELWPGKYVLRVSRPGYQSASSEINIAALPLEQPFDATLVPVVTLVDLKVKTTPEDVELYLDDVPKGASGADGLYVIRQVDPTKPHKLRGRKPPDFRPHEIEVPPGKSEIEITLPPAIFNLRVKTDPPESYVYLNDMPKGESGRAGVLVLELSTDQVHKIRVEKKPEYVGRIVEVQPSQYLGKAGEGSSNQPEITVKLELDPVVARSKTLKQLLDSGKLQDAFNTYTVLSQERPDFEGLPRMLDGLLQGLQTRSTNLITQVGPYGLPVGPDESREMSQFYEQARKLRPGDSSVAALAEYWRMKSLVAAARQTPDPNARASLLRNAAAVASVVDTLNPQNAQVLFDSAWVQMRAGDAAAARKGFELTQRLSPAWALPHFALGLMDMNAADQERAKQARSAGYQEAIGKFTRAVEIKRDFFHAYALRCLAYATINMHNEAVSDGLLAVAMRPQNAYGHFALGFAYFQKGKSEYRNALRNFEDALTLKEDQLDEATRLSVQQKVAVVKKSLGIKS